MSVCFHFLRVCVHIIWYGNSIFKFLRNWPNFYPKWLPHFIFLPKNVQVFQCLHILANTYYRHFLFSYSHPTGGCGISLWFWFAFSCWLIMLSSLVCLLATGMSSLDRCLSKSFVHCWIGSSFYYWFVRALYILWIQVHWYDLHIFSHLWNFLPLSR